MCFTPYGHKTERTNEGRLNIKLEHIQAHKDYGESDVKEKNKFSCKNKNKNLFD